MTKQLKQFATVSAMIMTIFIGQSFGSLNVNAASLRTQSSPVSTSAGGPTSSSTLVQTVRGAGDWIYTRRSTTCGASWSSWVKDGQMKGSSDTVSIGSSLVQTVRGAGDWIYTRNSSDKGLTWSSWFKDGQMYDSADTVVFYDYSSLTIRLVQTVRGSGNWIYTRYSDNYGANWSSWVKNGQMYGRSSTVSLYSVVTDKNTLVQTVRGAGDWIYTRTSLDGITWTSWVKNGQMYDESDNVSFYDYDINTGTGMFKILQTVRGAGDWIYSRKTSDGINWTPWLQSGQMYSPSSTALLKGELVQTVRGAGDWIYTRTSLDGVTWTPWVKNGQMISRADTELCYDFSITTDKLVQTVMGSGNWIYTRTTTDGSTWSSWVKDGQMYSPSDTVEIY
jgi:hypothetical protein